MEQESIFHPVMTNKTKITIAIKKIKGFIVLFGDTIAISDLNKSAWFLSVQ